MTACSKADFARLAGTTRSAVGSAVARGVLATDADGKIDDAHPLAIAYLARHRSAAPAHGKGGVGRPIAGGAGSAIPLDGADEPLPKGNLDEQRLALGNRLLAAKVKRERLRLREETGATVPLEIVMRGMSHLAQALEWSFREFGAAHADELYSIAAAGRPCADLRAALDAAIDRAMKDAIRTVGDEIGRMRPSDANLRDAPELAWLRRLLNGGAA
jgi:hypothetical protein